MSKRNVRSEGPYRDVTHKQRRVLIIHLALPIHEVAGPTKFRWAVNLKSRSGTQVAVPSHAILTDAWPNFELLTWL